MQQPFVIAPFPLSEWVENGYSFNQPIGQFELDADVFQKKLIERWPEAVFHSPKSAKYLLSWTLPVSRQGFGGLDGQVTASGQIAIIGTGPKESLIDFILWYIEYVRSQSALYLFSAHKVSALKLTADTTAQDIIEHTGIID